MSLSVAAGCGDDDDEPGEPTNEAGAGGEAGSGGSDDMAGASPGGSAGGGGGPAGGGDGGAAGGGGDGGAAGGGAAGGGAAGEAGAGGQPSDPLASSTVVDLNDVVANPEPYEWFDFRPNVQKLILAGAAETEHIAILWYTVVDGAVGLHYHAKTESVYVIDGTQTDAKGTYTDGTVYFNPPTSGHAISDSSGFFLLAYAAPPDFASTGLIQQYTPVVIDTTSPDLTTTLDFSEQGEGTQTYAVPLDETGGLAGELIETTATEPYAFSGNYLLVLEGTCAVEGVPLADGMLVVAPGIEPQPYAVSAPAGERCLALGVSF